MLTFFIIKNLTTDLLFYTVLISAAFFLFFTTLKELFIKKFNNVNRLEAKNNFLRDILLQVPKALIETVVVFLLVVIISSMYIKPSPE